MGIDQYLFTAVNSLAGSQYIDHIFVLITHAGVPVLLLMLLLNQRKALGKGIIAFIAAILVYIIINFFSYRERPFANGTVNLLVNQQPDSSFPSRHTITAFAVAQSIYLANRKTGIIAYAIALLVGVSRIYVGVHYPSDILGGIILGVLAAQGVEVGERLMRGKFWRRF